MGAAIDLSRYLWPDLYHGRQPQDVVRISDAARARGHCMHLAAPAHWLDDYTLSSVPTAVQAAHGTEWFFDGVDDYLTFRRAVTIGANFTFLARIKQDINEPSYLFRIPASSGNNSLFEAYYYLGRLYIDRYSSTGAPTTLTSPLLDTGVWYDIAIVCEGGSLTVKTRGLADASTSSAARGTTTNSPTISFSTGTNAWNGSIAWAHLYTSALGDGEISALWNDPFSVFAAPDIPMPGAAAGGTPTSINVAASNITTTGARITATLSF